MFSFKAYQEFYPDVELKKPYSLKNQSLIILSCLFISLTSFGKSNVFTGNKNIKDAHETKILYDELHLSNAGLSEKAFSYAYKGYLYLLKNKKLDTKNILTICDLSQSSNKKRFYVLDLAARKILITSYVAHGRGAGFEYAKRFSNRSNSHQSSLGFYITHSTYYGQNGLSLKLEGLEHGFNDLAVKRGIVVHGADYIDEEHLLTNKFMGRSYGCPAIPQDQCDAIIDLIKDGTCLFIYHPTRKYLQNSKILNG